MIAAALAYVVFQSDPAPQRLSAWETRAGWRLLFDGVDASIWGGGARALDGGLVAPDGEQEELTFADALDDFELELEVGASKDRAAPRTRLRAVARAGKLEVWDGTVHFAALDVPPNSRVSLGAIAVEHDPRWRLHLRASEGRDAFRAVRLRELDTLPAPSRALFDGTTLAGWRAIGDARWTVEDGCIVGAIGGGKQSFLVTEKEYGDFVLDVDLQNELPGNSGVQVRSHQRENGAVFGYQIEIDPSPRAWSGGLYDEGRRAWLADLSKDPLARAAFTPGKWNHYRIECLGPHVRTWVNGTRCVDALDPIDAAGFIGLQVHSGRDTKVRWRNFELRELGASAWRPLALADAGQPGAPELLLGGDVVSFASTEEYGDLVLHVRRETLAPRVFALLLHAPRIPALGEERYAYFESCGAAVRSDGWRLPMPDAERAAPSQPVTLPEDLWITLAGSRVQILSGHRKVLDGHEPRGPQRGHVLVEGSRREGASSGDLSAEVRVPEPR